jgi:ParB family chromosome partitioning protein
MQLEFHQLERRWEHLRVRRPERQRRLLASLAASGQQTPIVVVAVANQADRYLVIDGYKRIAALEQLGRDTVEAVLWSMSEAEAVVLERSLRFSPRESALEEGWLLAELEQHFGYGLEELARRFDRTVSWVSRRLALTELLPQSVQQQVRAGQISAHVAMKFLLPVARASVADCRRMAEVLVAHQFTTRQAAQLFAAWRDAAPGIRQRILEQPELFLKAQQQVDPHPRTNSGYELLRDLEMVAAIAQRASRRHRQAAAGMDRRQCEDARRTIDRAVQQLGRLAERIEEEQQHVEPSTTDSDFRTSSPGSEQTGNSADSGPLPSHGAQSAALELSRGAGDAPPRESRTPPATDPGAFQQLQGEPGAGP